MHTQLTRLPHPTQDDRPTEVVERKGRGHPDTLCDVTAEAFSIALTEHYMERFGEPLHHNVDKTLLIAGSTTPAFGGGRVDAPMELVLAGRATLEYQGTRVPVEEIAVETARRVLGETLHALEPDRGVTVQTRVRPGSSELVELFDRVPGGAPANDTSCGVGFAPLSRLERVVLAAELALSDASTTRVHPFIGEDVKVLGIRRDRAIELTVATATVDRHVANLDAYRDAMETIAEIVRAAALEEIGVPDDVRVNAADDVEQGSIYLTVTGTSAESGDDGQAGRGNRVGGLITPYRPMVMESAAGKNAWSHPGKIYSVLAGQISRSLVAHIPDVESATCLLASRIGSPIDHPMLADVQLGGRGDLPVEPLRSRVDELIRAELAGIDDVREALLSGSIALF